MFDPIKASKEIKDSYIDYITTTFDMADTDYEREFRKELQTDGMVASGPFLDIGGSYETGHTLRELIQAQKASILFENLEPVAEKERELKLDRPLYQHQETAMLKAGKGENLVVTTGTGSGKTESFLLPIINHLLREQEAGTLYAGVRAIIIYPMNALANDQMKRMRALFKNYPQICYGVYNGNTEHTQSKALAEYHRTYHDEAGEPIDPAPNEIISREVMQERPPHILITNYSMLEYMMLRPKDDAVFSGAKLKFIVLDEAHIYKGATGMETSLLMRRLRARISEPDSVQYILTSATLGGPDADGDILSFAEKLRECVSCHTPIKRLSWRKTLEPRMGFCAEKEARPVPMHRPEHDFKTDDYYIGDPHRNLIAKQIFEVNGQALQIESTSNDSLVVIGQTDYKVCPACGYASETGIPLEHKNSRGYRCVNKEGNSAEYRLSHDFKTDVAKITFVTQEAADINVMLSVLYALLEGLSREMGIERTDIKGCLFYTSVDGCMIFSVVLYDAVAGGAGHVRRIVTADGQAFQRVLAKAISVVDNCDCDSSCYRCLRNYYNQKIHDNLNRNQASAFLHQWVGNMNPLPMETIE